MDNTTVKNALTKIGYQVPFKVVFAKKDGSLRTMFCMMEQPEGPPKYEHLVPVIDLDVNGWRSFDINKVVSLEVVA